MEVVLLIIHILASLAIVVTILLQSGKGGGLGSGFGGAGAAATQIFGGRGAGNFLSRMTVVLAAVFMTTSLTLAYLSSQPRSLMDLEADGGGGSVVEDEIIESGSGSPEGDSAPAPAPTPSEGSAVPTLNDINSVPTETAPDSIREGEPEADEPTDALEETGGEEAVDEAPGGGAEVDAPAPKPAAAPEEAKGAAAPAAKPAPAEKAPEAAPEKSKKREAASDGAAAAPTGSTTKANAEDEAILAPAKSDAPATTD